MPSEGERTTICVVFFQAEPIAAVLSPVTGAVESGTMLNAVAELLPTRSYATTRLDCPANAAPVVQPYVWA